MDVSSGGRTLRFGTTKGGVYLVYEASGSVIPKGEPRYVSRSDGLLLLQDRWNAFVHVGEVPGPTERVENGSTLGWFGASSWDGGRPSAPGVSPRENIPGEAHVSRWLIDSGCGSDLVDAKSVAHLGDRVEELPEKPRLLTANGITEVSHDIPLWVSPMGVVRRPLVMNNSPDVLSMGKFVSRRGMISIGLEAASGRTLSFREARSAST